MRRLVTALAVPLALSAACTQDPPGRCQEDLECLEGQICTEGLCVRLESDGQIGSLCARDTDCVDWGECLSRTCALRADRCLLDAHCAGWEVCDLGLHACATAPGGCNDVGLSCEAWQDCVAWRCETAPGFCADDRPCETWQVCDAGHLCATAPGFCATSGDCHAPQECNGDHVCFDPDPGVVPDPGGVLLFGTVHPGTCGRGGIARLDAPDSPLVGSAACSSAGGAYVGPVGEIVYLDDGNSEWKLRTFVRDSFRWDDFLGQWEYPGDPAANDGVIPTPACDGQQITSWVMQAGTGAILYACGNLDYFDEAGDPATTGWTLHAWNANGLKLASAGGTPVLLDAAGAPTSVTGLPAERLSAWRTHLDGFRVVTFTAATEARDLYQIDATGAATLAAAYAPAPVGFTESDRYALAANGDLYVVGTVDGISDVVVRFTAGDAAVVYDEANGPADLTGYLANWLQDPLALYTFVDGDRVVTGP